MKRGQVVSFDLLSGVLLFLIFVAVFILVFFLPRFEVTPPEFEAELLFVFDNLEQTLEGTSEQFMTRGYRVDYDGLSQFYSLESIDEAVFGKDPTGGIALYPDGYDVCLYIMDVDGDFLDVNGRVAAGNLSVAGQTCDAVLRGGGNPCAEYERGMTTFRPVVLLNPPSEDNRIVQLNVVACKI